MRILIVEDSSTMRRIIANTVKQTCSDIVYMDDAEDGVKAWKFLKDKEYDIVITDWNMPNMNGFDLIQKIRSEGINRGTKIIMLTTEGSKVEVIRALKVGANDYIVKPINPKILQEKLRKYFI